VRRGEITCLARCVTKEEGRRPLARGHWCARGSSPWQHGLALSVLAGPLGRYSARAACGWPFPAHFLAKGGSFRRALRAFPACRRREDNAASSGRQRAYLGELAATGGMTAAGEGMWACEQTATPHEPLSTSGSNM
jgi:hypothetical protein